MSRKTDIYQLAGSDASLNNANKGTEAGVRQMSEFYESRRQHQKNMLDRLNKLDQMIAKHDTVVGQDAKGNPIVFKYDQEQLRNFERARQQTMHSIPSAPIDGYLQFLPSENVSFVGQSDQNKINQNAAKNEYEREVALTQPGTQLTGYPQARPTPLGSLNYTLGQRQQPAQRSRFSELIGYYAGDNDPNLTPVKKPEGTEYDWMQKMVSDTFATARNNQAIVMDVHQYLKNDPNYATASPAARIAKENQVWDQAAANNAMLTAGYNPYDLMTNNPSKYQALLKTIYDVKKGSEATISGRPIPSGIPYQTATPYSQQHALPQYFKMPTGNPASTGSGIFINGNKR